MPASKELILQVNEAFNRNDMSAFLSLCNEDIEWNMMGSTSAKGKTAILAMMQQMPPVELSISISNILFAGDQAACTGRFTMKNKEGVTTDYHFCDVYVFSGNLIAKLDSYVVENKG